MWLSLVERFVRDEEVAGSNPVTAIFLMGIFGGLSPDVLIFLCENQGALHETLHENEISFKNPTYILDFFPKNNILFLVMQCYNKYVTAPILVTERGHLFCTT